MRDIGVLQIDTVNVFSRSHYMPMFSRLGAYDTGTFDDLMFRADGDYVEYWAHAATLVPVADWSLWNFRMEANRAKYGETAGKWVAENAATMQWVRDELAARGPLRPAEIEDDSHQGARGPWWDWNRVKLALEYMFMFGDVAVAGRRGFERRYGLTEHVIPEQHRGAPVAKDDAIRELMSRALASYGVATTADLADYYRVPVAAATKALADLRDAGTAIPTYVEGWQRNGKPIMAWRHHEAAIARSVPPAVLLTPFDPLVWFRDRAARLYDFDYRIEIYTPSHKREFGYYSLPILADGDIVGRVDLKADRARSTLLVQSAWWECPEDRRHAPAVAEELRLAARWQGLEALSVSSWGSATADLRAALPGAARHDRQE
nr:crosslink repair DNA glycosylase YcaQ family protein [Microbacterium sp. NC79]